MMISCPTAMAVSLRGEAIMAMGLVGGWLTGVLAGAQAEIIKINPKVTSKIRGSDKTLFFMR
jgi:hypothetical protein